MGSADDDIRYELIAHADGVSFWRNKATAFVLLSLLALVYAKHLPVITCLMGLEAVGPPSPLPVCVFLHGAGVTLVQTLDTHIRDYWGERTANFSNPCNVQQSM